MTWRSNANEVIHKAIEEIAAETSDIDELFKRISKEHYPFGERRYHPYKIWLNAIQKNKDEYLHGLFPRPQEPIDYNTGMFEGGE